ncbi:MAG: hypothetical protein EOO07_28895 [Chitinophagaceae bacterium]|nr:MAG: hypothetical protein EOO07_28895 [Chitinophagaceae bacterium]
MALDTNKCIPKILEKPILQALSHYPDLLKTHINFVFKQNINGSVMQAQPLPASLFKNRKNRKYQINISSMLKLVHSATPIHQLPENIIVGWIGHELGHIMDYEQRSKWGLVKFGILYIFSKHQRQLNETMADTYAVNHGLAPYIIETKKFILNNAELPSAYKEKIARLYLSPDDIVEQVRKLEEKKLDAQKKALKESSKSQ